MTIVAITATAHSARGGDFVRRQGTHIHLTTDLASAEEAETLVASFDAAVPQWESFWGLPAGSLSDWKVDAYVMRDKAEFRRRDLIPSRVPDFPFGYALGNQLFVLAQQSEYYTRHLLLHEGVHALAFHQFGGTGPTWFREGTAELLATHRGQRDSTRVDQIPASRDDVPYWGRFKLISQLRDEGVVPTIESVMRYKPDLRGDVESYSWSWAAVMLLSRYPEYRDALLSAAARGRDQGPGFNRKLLRDLQRQWPIVAARWRLMCHDLDYGFDWSRERVALSARDPRWDGKPIRLQVSPAAGWQSIGVRVPGPTKLRVSPAGEIVLARTTRPWNSRPPGITYRYHRGRPLGQLLVAILPNAHNSDAKTIQPLRVQAVGHDTTLQIDAYSWILFRVNEGAGDLGDNSGTYSVTVTRVPPP